MNRLTAVVPLAAVVAVTATGCNTAALSKRELVVVFRPDASDAQRAAAHSACTGVAANTTPEPIVTSTHAAGRTSDVRFRIDDANDRDIAHLEACLAKQPGVLGFQDTSDLTN